MRQDEFSLFTKASATSCFDGWKNRSIKARRMSSETGGILSMMKPVHGILSSAGSLLVKSLQKVLSLPVWNSNPRGTHGMKTSSWKSRRSLRETSYFLPSCSVVLGMIEIVEKDLRWKVREYLLNSRHDYVMSQSQPVRMISFTHEMMSNKCHKYINLPLPHSHR